MHLPWLKIEPHGVRHELVQGADAVFSQKHGFGWYIGQDKILPAVRLQNSETQEWHTWIHYPTNPKGARHRFEHRITEALSHHIPHDVNGKLMGIDGILESWRDGAPDANSVTEDLKLIRESLDPLRKLTNVFSWFYKEGKTQDRAFSMQELQDVFSEAVSRFFKPAQLLNVQAFDTSDANNSSVMSSPHLMTFWFFSIGILLAEYKQKEETASILFRASEDHHQLIFRLKCQTLPPLFEQNAAQASKTFWDWILLLGYQNATWKKWEDGLEITIPLNRFANSAVKTLALGPTTDFGASNEAFLILPNYELPQIVEPLVEHLFSIEEISIGKSVDVQARGRILELLTSVRGVDELKLVST